MAPILLIIFSCLTVSSALAGSLTLYYGVEHNNDYKLLTGGTAAATSTIFFSLLTCYLLVVALKGI